MDEELQPQVRLYAILAREAKFVVVFRRGPSKRVQLLLWHTDSDEFQEGQWFKGRIYERRSDLSPSDLPGNLKVKPLGGHSGGGEDSPIMDLRLARDGWKQIQDGEAIQHGQRHSIWIKFKPPLVYSKRHMQTRGRYELQMHIHGLKQREGSWYIIEHVVQDTENGTTVSLGRSEWADWCHSGDLLFASYGRLFRLGFSPRGVLNELTAAKVVIDLNNRTYREMEAPGEAKRWD